ncbi:MAG: histidine kinase [Rhodobacteraceae bacterium]|nr:MAG: histidine kinase [Paracoccaceae bacterium]
MIDWIQLRQLQSDVGKDEMDEVVELFLTEVDEAIEVFQKNVGAMAFADKGAAYHFLKGCAFNLGFQAFGEKCSEGEEVSKQNKNPDISLSDLVALYAASKDVFHRNYKAEMIL